MATWVLVVAGILLPSLAAIRSTGSPGQFLAQGGLLKVVWGAAPFVVFPIAARFAQRSWVRRMVVALAVVTVLTGVVGYLGCCRIAKETRRPCSLCSFPSGSGPPPFWPDSLGFCAFRGSGGYGRGEKDDSGFLTAFEGGSRAGWEVRNRVRNGVRIRGRDEKNRSSVVRVFKSCVMVGLGIPGHCLRNPFEAW